MEQFWNGFEKRAAAVNVKFLKGLTREQLLPEGQSLLRRMETIPRITGGVAGAGLGGVSGYANSDGEHSFRDSLLGATAGGIAGLGAGYFGGKHMANNRLENINGALKNIHNSYRAHRDFTLHKDIPAWKDTRNKIRQGVKSYYSEVPPEDLHELLRKHIPNAAGQEDLARKELSGALKHNNPRKALSHALDFAHLSPHDLTQHINKARSGRVPDFRPFFSLRSTSTPLLGLPHSMSTADMMGIIPKGLVDKHAPLYRTKTGPLSESTKQRAKLNAMQEFLGGAGIRPRLGDLNRATYKAEKAVKDTFESYTSDFEGAFHGSENHWNDFKKKYEDFFGGRRSSGGQRASDFGGSFGTERELSILGIKKENIKSKKQLLDAYKKMAFQHHPDRGGKLEDMQKINGAMDTIKKSSWFGGLK